ncbi:MAG: YciI-like protein [Dehalococcoidia bacterium]
MLYLLLYDYVPDILARREPHRPAHLDALRALHARGAVMMAGAAGDPVDSAVIVFDCDSPATVEQFARADPYVLNGLVTAWRVKPWTLAVGAAT